MDISFLVFFILLTIILAFLAVMFYGYSFHYFCLYYKTSKFKLYSIWPVLLVGIIFLILMFVAFAFQYGDHTEEFFTNNAYISYYSLFISLFCFAIFALVFCLKNKADKSIHSIKDFYQEDFQKQIDELKSSNNFIKINTKVANSNSKFVFEMNAKSNEINKMIDEHQPFEKTLFEIIKFNEIFTPKFSKNIAVYHLNLFLNLCLKLKNQTK